MKSNFMIQAEIDIARHPEWDEYEKFLCRQQASIKGRNLERRLSMKKGFDFNELIGQFVDWPTRQLDLEYEQPIWRSIHPNIILGEPWM